MVRQQIVFRLLAVCQKSPTRKEITWWSDEVAGGGGLSSGFPFFRLESSKRLFSRKFFFYDLKMEGHFCFFWFVLSARPPILAEGTHMSSCPRKRPVFSPVGPVV